MRIKVTMSGGFSGLRSTRVLDTDELSGALTARFGSLLANAGAAPRGRSRDARSYMFRDEADAASAGTVVVEGASADGDELLGILRERLPVFR